MNIRDEIKRLASEWINPVYADRFDASHVLKDLMAHAFLHGIDRHSDDGLILLEAHRRLQAGALDGEYQKGDYFAATTPDFLAVGTRVRRRHKHAVDVGKVTEVRTDPLRYTVLWSDGDVVVCLRGDLEVIVDLNVDPGQTGIRTSEVTEPVRIRRMTVSGPGAVGIDMDDES